MPTPRKGPRLGRSPQNERLILKNLATSLISDGKVETTLAKAKAVRPVVEKMITKARKESVHGRRVIRRTITDDATLAKLYKEVAPSYMERPGGYTRITKLGPRRGDGAEMAVIELV